MTAAEHDPRIKTVFRRGDDPRTVNQRLGWMLAFVVVAIAVVFTISAAIDLFRPDRTKSDATFEFSEACGGTVNEGVLNFERFMFPAPIMETVNSQNRQNGFPLVSWIDVRDDAGKLGSASTNSGAQRTQTAPIPVSVSIVLDREPVGELRCVAWTDFRTR